METHKENVATIKCAAPAMTTEQIRERIRREETSFRRKDIIDALREELGKRTEGLWLIDQIPEMSDRELDSAVYSEFAGPQRPAVMNALHREVGERAERRGRERLQGGNVHLPGATHPDPEACAIGPSEHLKDAMGYATSPPPWGEETDLRGRIEWLEVQLKGAQGKGAELGRRVEELKAQVREAEEETRAIERDNAEKATLIASLKETLASYRKSDEYLRSQIEVERRIIGLYERTIRSLKGKVSEMEIHRKSYFEKIQALESQREKILRENKILCERVDELESWVRERELGSSLLEWRLARARKKEGGYQ